MHKRTLTGCRFLLVLTVILTALSLVLVFSFTTGWADSDGLSQVQQAIKAKESRAAQAR